MTDELVDSLLKETMLETAKEMGEEEAWKFLCDLPGEIGIMDEALAMAILTTHPQIKERMRESAHKMCDEMREMIDVLEAP